MIRYSSMTMGQAVDEVMLRLGQQRTALNLDMQTVMTFVNRARREVLNKTLPYKDWAYTLNNIPIVHGQRLPNVDVGTFLNPDGWTEPSIEPPSLGLYVERAFVSGSWTIIPYHSIQALLEPGVSYTFRSINNESFSFQLTTPGAIPHNVSYTNGSTFTAVSSSTGAQAISVSSLPNGVKIHIYKTLDLALTNPTIYVPLSWIFIKPIRVLLRPVSSTPEVEYQEARYMDPKEYFTMSDWRSRQSWNSATSVYPTYTFWGAKNSQLDANGNPDDHLYFYAAPSNDIEGYMNWQTGIVPSGFSYASANMEGFMDCYVGYPELYDLNAPLLVPYEFENLMIVYTMMRCLAKIGATAKLKQYHEESTREQRRMREMFAISKSNMKRNLESLADFRGVSAQQQQAE